MLTHLHEPDNRDYLPKLTVAFLITAVGGFVATKYPAFQAAGNGSPDRAGNDHRRRRHPRHRSLLANRPWRLDVTWHVAVWVGAGSDTRGGPSGHLALGRDHLCGDARRSDLAARGH